MINLENLIDKQYVEVQEHGEQGSFFLIKPFEMFLIYGAEKVSSESKTRISKQKSWQRSNNGGKGKRNLTGRTRKLSWQYKYKSVEKRNTNNIYMLYEWMLSNLQMETIF